MSRCHDSPSTSLAASVPKSGNSKACLIDRGKKKTERKTSPANHQQSFCGMANISGGVGIARHFYSDHLFGKSLSLSLSLRQL